uniref:Uncharacterized protein n=1 Tax=Theileria annulata TaxID=5874 RepID=A0A3B0N431_THEAN
MLINKFIKIKHINSHLFIYNSIASEPTFKNYNPSISKFNLISTNQYYTSNSARESEKFKEFSRYLIESETERRNRKLKELTVQNYLKKLKLRERNLARPPLIYEGPVYLNYWLRRRRSGARK